MRRIATSGMVLILLLTTMWVSVVNAQGSWVSMPYCPQPVLYGADLAWTGGDYIYALVGYDTPYFLRYSISGYSWGFMPNVPYPVYYGGCLAWAGGDYIYAFHGRNSPYFLMYTISGNFWRQMPNVGPPVFDGASLVWIGGDYIYAFIGNNGQYFFRYSISGNFWTQLPSTPFPQQSGADLVWTGGDYLYAFRGGGTPLFFRYSISGNSWVSMANCPYSVSYGGSLVWTEGNFIYAFVGGGAPFFLRYSISGNSWTPMPNVGPPVQPGGCLENAYRYIYAFTGAAPYFRRYEHADVAIVDTNVSKTVVGQGYSATINITAENQGGFTEIFNIRAYANATEIKTMGLTLACGISTTSTFAWNTTGFAKGYYDISASADTVPGETETGDNNFDDGRILVTIPGDGNGDRICDMRDITQMILKYGSRIGDPWYSADFDITCEGIIDMKDITIAILNYGQRW